MTARVHLDLSLKYRWGIFPYPFIHLLFALILILSPPHSGSFINSLILSITLKLEEAAVPNSSSDKNQDPTFRFLDVNRESVDGGDIGGLLYGCGSGCV